MERAVTAALVSHLELKVTLARSYNAQVVPERIKDLTTNFVLAQGLQNGLVVVLC